MSLCHQLIRHLTTASALSPWKELRDPLVPVSCGVTWQSGGPVTIGPFDIHTIPVSSLLSLVVSRTNSTTLTARHQPAPLAPLAPPTRRPQVSHPYRQLVIPQMFLHLCFMR